MWLQQSFPEKAEFTAHCTCIGGKPLAPHFPEGNPSATRMLYPGLIVMSIILELRTQSHHHYNPFKDNSPPAFIDQSKKRLSAPNFTDVTHSLKLAGAFLPCFSAISYSVLRGDTRMKHQLQQPRQDALGAATATIPNSPGWADSFFL